MNEAASRRSAFGSMLRAFVAVFAFVFAPSIAVEALVRAFGDEAMRTSMPAKMGGVAFAALVLFSLARALPPGPAFAPMRPLSVVPRYAAFFVAWAIFAVGCIALLHALGVAIEPQPLLVHVERNGVSNFGSVVVVLGIVLFGPLAEEIVFRGYLQEFCASCVGERMGNLATAGLFGLVHGASYALPIAVLGWFLGDLRRRHASLLAPWLAHAMHNAISVCLVLFWPDFLDWMYPR